MDALLKLARKGKVDELESAWPEFVAEGGFSADQLLDVPRTLASRGHEGSAESLLWYLVDSLREAGDCRAALRVAREAGRIVPRSGVVRELLADLYAEAPAGRDDAPQIIRCTIGSELPLDEALTCLDRLLALTPGAYVLDSRLAEAGRVIGFDPDSPGLVVEFADGEKRYAPAFAAGLEPLEPDDFRALVAFERQRMESLADEDPEELVRLLLTTLDRRMELRRVRLYLEPLVGSWNRWWSGARGSLRRSALVGVTRGSSPSLFLRTRPLTHEQRLVRRFAALTGEADRLAAALAGLAELQEATDGGGEFAAAVAETLAGRAGGAHDESGVVRFCAAAVLDAVCTRFPGLLPSDWRPPEVPDDRALEALVTGGFQPAVVLCALDYIQKLEPGRWADSVVALVPLAGRAACEAATGRLLAAGREEALSRACSDVLQHPVASIGALAWLWRETTRDPPQPAFAAVDAFALLVKMLATAAAVVRDPEASADRRKEQLAEVRAALFVRNGQALEAALSGVRPERLAPLARIAEHHPALTEQMRARVARALNRAAPSLFVKDVRPWQHSLVYATEEGIRKRREELTHLVNVRLPEIIREIGEAAAFGDLTDNAEYESAVRERGRLAEMAQRMQEELASARTITRELASVDHVTVGSRVVARSADTGMQEALTFLGPWDARPDEGVYAYNAPLGLAFMGAQVGETVTFELGGETRVWEVLQVEPALE
jgi:transcription elongation factor GreA